MAIKKLKWLSPQIYPIGRNNQKKKSKNFIIGLENRIFSHMHPKSRRVSRSGIIGAGAGKKKKPHWKPADFYNGPNPEPASREERERVPHSATAQDPETIRTQFASLLLCAAGNRPLGSPDSKESGRTRSRHKIAGYGGCRANRQ